MLRHRKPALWPHKYTKHETRPLFKHCWYLEVVRCVQCDLIRGAEMSVVETQSMHATHLHESVCAALIPTHEYADARKRLQLLICMMTCARHQSWLGTLAREYDIHWEAPNFWWCVLY